MNYETRCIELCNFIDGICKNKVESWKMHWTSKTGTRTIQNMLFLKMHTIQQNFKPIFGLLTASAISVFLKGKSKEFSINNIFQVGLFFNSFSKVGTQLQLVTKVLLMWAVTRKWVVIDTFENVAILIGAICDTLCVTLFCAKNSQLLTEKSQFSVKYAMPNTYCKVSEEGQVVLWN